MNETDKSLERYAIFDSRDRLCSGYERSDMALWGLVDSLNQEAIEEGSRTTYAILKIRADGSITSEF